MPEPTQASSVCPACGGVCKLGVDRCEYCGSPFIAALGPGSQEGDARARVADLVGRLEKRPDDAQARLELGKAWHECGEFDKAQEQLQAAVTLDPKKAEAFYLLAWNAAMRFGWTNREIERQARFALALKPSYPQAQALIHVSRGVQKQLYGDGESDDELALAEFVKAVEADPENAYGWYYAGVVHERHDNLKEARRCYERAAADALADPAPGPSDARIFTRLGLLCVQLEDRAAARKYLEQAAGLDPDNQAAKEFLSRLR